MMAIINKPEEVISELINVCSHHLLTVVNSSIFASFTFQVATFQIEDLLHGLKQKFVHRCSNLIVFLMNAFNMHNQVNDVTCSQLQYNTTLLLPVIINDNFYFQLKIS